MSTQAIGLLMSIVAAPAFAAVPDQFDLKCVGTGRSYDSGRKFEGSMTRVLHVDLTTNQYCVDDCQTVLRIARADPVKITFQQIDNSGGALDKFTNREAVDRRTGSYDLATLDAAGRKFQFMKGTCSATSFTSFPKTKF